MARHPSFIYKKTKIIFGLTIGEVIFIGVLLSISLLGIRAFAIQLPLFFTFLILKTRGTNIVEKIKISLFSLFSSKTLPYKGVGLKGGRDV